MSIENLPYRKAISLIKEIRTYGNSPIIALGDDYELYVAKNSKNKNPASDIINEVVGYYLLRAWDIPVPPCAIMDINHTLLLEEFSKQNHKPIFYSKPVFASKKIESNDLNLFFEINKRKDFNRFINPLTIFKIGLFDIWIENDDRKPTNNNILFQAINGLNKIVAIDHSFIFSTIDYNDLDLNNFNPIYNDNILCTDFAISLKKYKNKIRKWKEIDEEEFYLCIEKSKELFDIIYRNIPQSWGYTEENHNNLYNFLFNSKRNKEVFFDYLDKMQ